MFIFLIYIIYYIYKKFLCRDLSGITLLFPAHISVPVR
nr:MAG TPA: hypothetical protein [Caudoviricetes sp.]